jgi:hypothetical protein
MTAESDLELFTYMSDSDIEKLGAICPEAIIRS